MSDHVFISYSRDDQTYVDRLARHLQLHGVEVWIDHEIDLGARWATVVRDRIDTCAAFIVVMTPAAEQSSWVEREIQRAEAMSKPIHPLLLDGPPFFRLGNIQYADVSDGDLPPDELLAQLPATPTRPGVRIRELRGIKDADFRAAELPLLKRGDRGAWVSALQEELVRVGRAPGASGIDGMFGPDTEHSVRTLQSREHIDVDGIVGPQTWLTLLLATR